MPSDPLHLVKVPLRAATFASIAKRRGISVRALDDGYLAHCLLAELWQHRAPSPFELRGSGRTLDLWGYSRSSAAELIDHARSFGDPEVLRAIDDVGSIASRSMPRFEKGREVGFLIRVSPIVRLSKAVNGHRAGAEVDAFLAHVFRESAEATTREAVYTQWFRDRIGTATDSGVALLRVTVGSMSRVRIVRRTQGKEREGRVLERPDVRLQGVLRVEDGDALLGLLARGVGRHRAFGFGALMVVPPGTSYGRT